MLHHIHKSNEMTVVSVKIYDSIEKMLGLQGVYSMIAIIDYEIYHCLKNL